VLKGKEKTLKRKRMQCKRMKDRNVDREGRKKARDGVMDEESWRRGGQEKKRKKRGSFALLLFLAHKKKSD
jgi:hypothetical protein